MREYLKMKSEEIGIEISNEQLNQFELYFNHLIEINQVMNLTAITEPKEVVVKHFIDSISILKYKIFSDNSYVIDVGTGAGFPGIPLAILLPNVHFTLMDSLNKRLNFLKEVIEMCGLSNVDLVHSRAEDLGNDKRYREQFDYCVSRAVANLSVLLEYCVPFVKTGGEFISYKAAIAEEEKEKSLHAQNILSCQLIEQINFDLSSEEYKRCFLIFKKINRLSNKYPKTSGHS